MESATTSKRAAKFRKEIIDVSEKYTTEMTDRAKYLAYQGWALELEKRKGLTKK